MNTANLVGTRAREPELGNDRFGEKVCRLHVEVARGRLAKLVPVDVKVFGRAASNSTVPLEPGQLVTITGGLAYRSGRAATA